MRPPTWFCGWRPTIPTPYRTPARSRSPPQRGGALLALIDWGDAGWGDPVLDFVAVPLEMMSAAFEGYGLTNRLRLGSFPEARIIWTKLHDAMDKAINQPGTAIPLALFRRFLDDR